MSDKSEVPEGYQVQDWSHPDYPDEEWLPDVSEDYQGDNMTKAEAIAACHAHKRARWAEGVRLAAQALRAAQRSTGGMDARVAPAQWLEKFADRIESGEVSK